jgi:hypothetical protein
MIALTALMVALLGYQVSMPAVDNAKFSYTIHENKVYRFNTQNGSMERCELTDHLTCTKIENKSN